MVSQILSSLMFAGSLIQVPNVCCTLTKWTGLPTDFMTHSSGRKSTCPWSVTLREKVALKSHFAAGYLLFLKDLGFCLQPFQRGYHHLVHRISHLGWREKEKMTYFTLFDMTDGLISGFIKIKEWQLGFFFIWKKKCLGWCGQKWDKRLTLTSAKEMKPSGWQSTLRNN